MTQTERALREVAGAVTRVKVARAQLDRALVGAHSAGATLRAIAAAAELSMETVRKRLRAQGEDTQRREVR